MWRLGPLVFLCIFLTACGGGISSPTTATNNGQSNPNPTPESSQLKAPVPVDLRTGSGATGIDITVASPVASPAPNAQDLGVNTSTGRASASNTGGVIHRGNTMRVILFGPGLNGQMQVTIGGAADITVSNVTAIQATDNTPGISFMAAAKSNAAVGARTVFLQNTSGDVTTFTGGLEVVP